ncbi:MAG: sigma-54-dependent Fis family transcriptional regulator, partial [Kiritimatiellaceae bacterium]|nr:sigma-54-dependent Fis family transcriptional regulator [Kiritimatiellaceae bacterium]
MPRILVVDDDAAILNLLTTVLIRKGYETTPVGDGDKALQLLLEHHYDLMISDINMTPVNGLDLLRKASSTLPDMGVIMLTADLSVSTAVEAMKEGAFDYLTKPFKLDEFVLTVQRALKYHEAITENKKLKAQLDCLDTPVGLLAKSSGMRRVCDMIERVAPTSTTVLIYGESGTGKELVARALHEYSPRKNETFMAVNCAALPPQLMESELFGHVKGAFTGANSTQSGLFEAAHGGTLFLDEINAMPLEMQSKLLRVLQDKKIRKVGGSEHTIVDVRILAASNEKLDDLIQQGRFREDLYYRLSVISLEIPPLRSRQEDIIPLVYHMMQCQLGANAELPIVDQETQVLLESHSWPGNVRELENAVQHALTFAQQGIITVDSLPEKLVKTIRTRSQADGTPSREEPVEAQTLKEFLHVKEKEFLSKTIERLGGNKEQAARELDIP